MHPQRNKYRNVIGHLNSAQGLKETNNIRTLTTYNVIEKVTGQLPKKSFGERSMIFLLFVLTFPIRIFRIFIKNYKEIKDSEWTSFFTDNNLEINKRLVATTGFDDCINFYILSSTDNKINKIINGKYFSNFIIKTNNGIFLRQFKSPKDWPNSSLVFIKFEKHKLEIITKSNSNYIDWTYKIIDENQIEIIIEKSDIYCKTLQIKKNKK